MKILSLDQSTKCSGWAFIEDGSLIECSAIRPFTGDYLEKIKQTSKGLEVLLNQYKPDLILIEDVQQVGNNATFKKLAQLQGYLIATADRYNIPIEIISVNTWRSKVGLMGKGIKRKQYKQLAIDKVEKEFKIKVSDDIAEAILIGKSYFL